jgi:polyhydroxyalkanoate synthesis regulator phasin
MDFFDKLGDSIVTAGKTVSDKAKEVSDTAKLNLDIKNKEMQLKDEYVALGKAYYEAHKDEEENDHITEIRKIDSLERDIKAIRNQIQSIQGKKVCPNCGAEVAEESNFCKNCGAKIS